MTLDNLPSDLELNELCRAIGNVVIQWGFVDHNLYLCLGIIYGKYGGKDKTDNDKIEKFLKRQLPFLRICFNNLDSLTAFKKEGLLLLDRIANLSDERDKIIHSTYAGYNEGFFSFNKFTFNRPQNIHIKNLNRTINYFFKVGKRIEVLAKDLGNFGLKLYEK